MNAFFFLQEFTTSTGLGRLFDAALSLGIMAVGVIVVWRYFSKQIDQKDAQIAKLYDEKHKLAVDIVHTIGSFETLIKATSPEPIRDAVIARLEEMHRDLRQAIDNIDK